MITVKITGGDPLIIEVGPASGGRLQGMSFVPQSWTGSGAMIMRRLLLAALCLACSTRAGAQTPAFASATIAGFTLGTSSVQVLGPASGSQQRGHVMIEVITPSTKIWCTFDGATAAVAGGAGTLVFSGEGSGFEWTPSDAWVPQKAINCVGSTSGIAVTVISAP